MARLVYLKNPLSLADREQFELAAGARPIDWLTEHYPQGCGGTVRFFLNGNELPLDDLDVRLESDDLAVLAVAPAGIVEAVLISILVSVIMSAVTMGLTMLFKKPESPAFATQDTGAAGRQASPVYDVNGQQNSARLGEPVPVVYGSVLTTPDYAAQPYTWFDESNNEYIDQLLVLGQGEFDVQTPLIGDTPFNMLPGGTASYQVIPASVHGQAMGNLGLGAWSRVFRENVVTSPEVSDQKLETAGDQLGPFRLSKNGQLGRWIEYDCTWPGGLYRQDSGGAILATTCEFDLWAREVAADGSYIGDPITLHGVQGTVSGIDPLRKTFMIDTGRVGSWAAAIIRYTEKDATGRTQNLMTWRACKLVVEPIAGRVYGDVTLMATRLRADKGVAYDSANLIRVKVTRKLPALGTGPKVATSSPADAFCDIVTNAEYGARRPLAEADTAALAALVPWWGPAYQFNAVYTSKTTIWNALTQALQGVAASPLPLGALISVAQEGIKPARQLMFTEQNMVKDTFTLNYEFDAIGRNDGVEIEYRDPATFAPAYAKFPTSSIDPEKLNLFGCTNKAHAEQYAKFLWQKAQKQRRAVEFSTELEGLIPYPGARVAVGHTMPRWGVSGFAFASAELADNEFLIDRDLPWDTVPGPHVMAFRDEWGGMTALIPAGEGQRRTVLLGSVPPPLAVPHDPTKEPVHFIWGTATTQARDFILTEIRPRGGVAVDIAGTIYEPEIYSGTMTFFATAVPI